MEVQSSFWSLRGDIIPLHLYREGGGGSLCKAVTVMGNLYIEMARLCSKSHIGQKDLYVIKRNVMYAEGLYMVYGRGIHIGRNYIY